MKKRSNAHSLNLMQKTCWYVMANRSDAVFFKKGPGRDIVFIDRLLNPEGKKTEADLDSDRPGTLASSASGSSIRHALDRRYAQHEQAAVRFARLIAQYLQQAKAEDRFEELVLTAGPHFLGLLRKELPSQLRACILDEIPKELHPPGSKEQILDHILQIS